MYKIAVFADAHIYSEKLGIEGSAFRLRSDLDQRLLAESGAIMDAAMTRILELSPDALLFAGDMTNDGEKYSHEEFRDRLAPIARKLPVYVVYATHDWCCDRNPKRFNADVVLHDVETLTPPELREFYHDFGADKAYSEYVNEIGASSYAAKLGGKIRLIALNDDTNGKGRAGYTPEHLEWILEQVKDAKDNGEYVILMEHHLVIAHTTPLVTGGMCIGDRDEMAETLAAAGVDIILCGHSHMLNTTKYTAANGNVMTQINVGSLTGYPAPVTYLTFNDEGECAVDVEFLDSFKYKGRYYDLEYIKRHLENVLADIFRSAISDKAEFCERICSIGVSRGLASRLFYVMRPLSRQLLTVTVGKTGALINGITGGKGIDKEALEKVKNDNLFEHILTIFLNLFNGTSVSYKEDDPVYIIVRDLASLPRRVINKIPGNKISTDFCGKLEQAAESLTAVPDPNNRHCVLKLK